MEASLPVLVAFLAKHVSSGSDSEESFQRNLKKDKVKIMIAIGNSQF